MLKRNTDLREKMQKSIDSAPGRTLPPSVPAGPMPRCWTRSRWTTTAVPPPSSRSAAISSPDSRALVIQPWDCTALKSIEKAIQNSDLGINPQNDGKCIRLTFPQLTEERRKELVKQIHKYAENGKVAVRNIRRDAMEAFKKKEKASEITEDDLQAGGEGPSEADGRELQEAR